MARTRLDPWGLALVLLFCGPLCRAADSPLADAVERSDRSGAAALLAQRVNVNQAQNDGMTALHWAAHLDDLETAKLLLSSKADVNAANHFGVPPLALACMNGNEAMVELLLASAQEPTRSSAATKRCS